MRLDKPRSLLAKNRTTNRPPAPNHVLLTPDKLTINGKNPAYIPEPLPPIDCRAFRRQRHHGLREVTA